MRGLGGRYGASLLYADNRIHACSKQGKTTVIESGPTIRELAANELDREFWASPAVADRSLLRRTHTPISCSKKVKGHKKNDKTHSTPFAKEIFESF